MEMVDQYEECSEVCEISWNFENGFPQEYPKLARKRKDTHNYYMCLVPLDTHSALEMVDMEFKDQLIDQTDISNHKRRSRRRRSGGGLQKDLRSEGSEEEEEEEEIEVVGDQDASAPLCAHIEFFKKERQFIVGGEPDGLEHFARAALCRSCGNFFAAGWNELREHLEAYCPHGCKRRSEAGVLQDCW